MRISDWSSDVCSSDLQILQELEFGRGFAMLRGLPVEDYDVESLYTIYWGLGVHLGTPMSQNAKGELIAEVTDRGKDYEQNNVRGYTTRAALVPHCDRTEAEIGRASGRERVGQKV